MHFFQWLLRTIIYPALISFGVRILIQLSQKYLIRYIRLMIFCDMILFILQNTIAPLSALGRVVFALFSSLIALFRCDASVMPIGVSYSISSIDATFSSYVSLIHLTALTSMNPSIIPSMELAANSVQDPSQAQPEPDSVT